MENDEVEKDESGNVKKLQYPQYTLNLAIEKALLLEEMYKTIDIRDEILAKELECQDEKSRTYMNWRSTLVKYNLLKRKDKSSGMYYVSDYVISLKEAINKKDLKEEIILLEKALYSSSIFNELKEHFIDELSLINEEKVKKVLKVKYRTATNDTIEKIAKIFVESIGYINSKKNNVENIQEELDLDIKTKNSDVTQEIIQKLDVAKIAKEIRINKIKELSFSWPLTEEKEIKLVFFYPEDLSEIDFEEYKMIHNHFENAFNKMKKIILPKVEKNIEIEEIPLLESNKKQ